MLRANPSSTFMFAAVADVGMGGHRLRCLVGQWRLIQPVLENGFYALV